MAKYQHTIEPLKKAYEKGGWTYAKLSTATGLSGSNLCSIMRGHFAPKIDQAIAIAEAMSVNPAKLIVKVEE